MRLDAESCAKQFVEIALEIGLSKDKIKGIKEILKWQ
jgi:hypothetical protein